MASKSEGGSSAEGNSVSKFDIVIFGASGYTGQYVVEETAYIASTQNLTWAIAGRDAGKLAEVLRNLSQLTGKNYGNISVIIANVGDEMSLQNMCKQAKVVLNCVGPYRFYGEQVVKACIENGAHHIDVSGEPQYLERMQLEYHNKAKEASVYVIGACGLDSIPCEIGLQYLRENFSGDLNGVEIFLETQQGPKKMHLNFGTWQSAIYGLAYSKELKPIRKKLMPDRLPESSFPLPSRFPIFHSEEVNGWCVPFPGSDRSVARRSQYYLYNEENIRNFKIKNYLKMQSLFATIVTMFVAAVFFILTRFSSGCRLLEKYPEVFSLGMFSKTGPKREQLEGVTFTMTFVGYGFEEKKANLSEQHVVPPSKKLTVQLRGPEPGYISTSRMMVQCGLLLLKEKNKLPPNGGVYPPGAAFFKTNLIQNLEARNITLHKEQEQVIA